MARYQFEDEREQGGEWMSRGTRITQLIVRALGFMLMFIGLWVGLSVISEAWTLYRNPHAIERMATAIEQGSNLDKTLATTRHAESEPLVKPDANGGKPAPAVTAADNPSFRLSYFVAWVIAMLLLMLIGRLAITAVKTGGELVLYDLQIKRFARELVRESTRNIGQP